MKTKTAVEQSDWNEKSLRSRIADVKEMKRWEAGSPNEEEINAYRAAIPNHGNTSTALVLGMTPELRRLATGIFDRCVTADKNPNSIAIYRDWLTSAEQEKEQIIETNWFELKKYLRQPADTIFGDGIFGNLTDIESHRRFLAFLADLLGEGGTLIVRKVFIPHGFDPNLESFENLLQRFRRGELDVVEFGFAARILGHYQSCYSPETCILDNKKVFDEIDELYRVGHINEKEKRAINRYYFPGRNCILTRDLWEEMLCRSGFQFATFDCIGRDWYRYYKVYQCRYIREPEI